VSVKVKNTVPKVFGEIAKNMTTETVKATLRAAQYICGVIQSKAPRGKTGALMRSFRPVFISRDAATKTIRVGAFSNLIYTKMREEGGVIKSSRPGGMLAIPISDKAKKQLVGPKYWDGPKLFLFKSKRGNALLAERTRRGDLKLHWVLKKSVKQEGSKFIEASIPEAQKIAAEELGAAAQIAIKTGGGAP